MKRVAIFCGANVGNNPEYTEVAQALTRALVSKGIAVVNGGGKVGLMGVVADEALRVGGECIGVIPQKLMDKEVAHLGMTELHLVPDMHTRKAMLQDLSDAFVALPGGIGTLEEIFEVFTWEQIGYHSKPCAFLNVAGYYDHLEAFMKHSVAEGFVSQAQLDKLFFGHSVQELVDWLLTERA